MEFNNLNGVGVKNEPAKQANNNSQNGAAKKDHAAQPAKAQTADAKPEADKPKAEPAVEAKQEVKQSEVQPAKVELTLDDKLKMVSDLHRRSVQRINLISRMRQLEAFEVALAQEGDELNENPYQGCKLIIRDDKGREFLTSTPGLIRMVSQFIFSECNLKLKEIESTINFPGV
ncbi:hypothetical protein ABDD95_18600 [Mucilaginibacter sp. PAMB04274]|uniref:hypothetical protein n=1 Tax=Mucilaginibacter sp. PAMB04274 TaxID=3138568 RepID=UPI0031F6968B